MANKLKTAVTVNNTDGADVILQLSPEQAVILLEFIVEGATVHIDLETPTNGHVREEPKAYAS